jgi:hypothetical protein
MSFPNMNKARVYFLLLVFLSAMVYQPNWVYENFWSKADFYDLIPFTMPYLAFLLIYSSISTAIVELGIRSVKKYA